ncbi:MAG: ABC transporter permease [Bacteroidales bacterium]|nr:ABC transporter permease [Bacteroidales bacterium]
MRKILVLVKREYRTAVRTKSFIIGLLLAPVFMGGSLIVFAIMEDKVDTSDKEIAVIDHSGVIADFLVGVADERNTNEIFNKETGDKIKPAYHLTVLDTDLNNPTDQLIDLSGKVRRRELHAFIEIGPDILHPGENQEMSRIKYYGENSLMDDVREWFSWPINNRIRQLRVEELNIEDEAVQDLFSWINVEGLGLISVDRKTGSVQEARHIGVAETIIVPYIIVFLMFMMLMMSAIPLLTAVMEEKMNKIAEVLLGSVTPFQFMMGKVLGGIAVSLTAASVYIIAGIVTATQLDVGHLIPYHVLPWFFAYLILNIIMVGSGMAALGSACNDNKDAQSLQFPAMLPMILPLFVMMPVIKEPLGSFATGLSLFPPFTPMLMLIRQSTPVTIPMWQPIVGLIGVAVFTAFTLWAGGRIFRTCILMQGQKPRLGNLIKYAIRG